MKNYKDVADEVFSRSKEIEAENKLRRRRITEIGVSAACWAAAGAVGFGIWKTHIADKIIPTSTTAASAGTLKVGMVPPVDDPDERCYPTHFYIHEKDPEAFYVNKYDNENGEKYAAPKNGDVTLTNTLKEAMAKYGSETKLGTDFENFNERFGVEVIYDVVIEYYKDGERYDPTEEFYENEVGKYDQKWCAYLTEKDNGLHYINMPSMSYDMLENFVPTEGYGCVIYLLKNLFEDFNVEIHYSDRCLEPIPGYITNLDTEYEETEYSAPENGKFVIGGSLKAAIEKYGREDINGEIYYEVLVEYYKDGERLDLAVFDDLMPQSNFDVVTWSHFLHSKEHTGGYICKQLTLDEIEHFLTDGRYGYVLHLSGAFLNRPYTLSSNTINGYYNNGVFFE